MQQKGHSNENVIDVEEDSEDESVSVLPLRKYPCMEFTQHFFVRKILKRGSEMQT